ncbi:restriction endonuclease [Acetoanaerobium noterae]|uniref:restriction endonuclease n=1 Tax=Acetoanaerobium noterae TaxID=745369 RepID=UPI0028AE6AB0|nr:restriction endonuclease [Acetoanaerobium noterae]
MFAYYESSSDIKDLLATLKQAVVEKRDSINIQNRLEEIDIYKIFYNSQDLISYNKLKLHIFDNCSDISEQELNEIIVIAFDLDMGALYENGILLTNNIHLKNFVIMNAFDLDMDSNIDNEEENITDATGDYKLVIENSLLCKPITLAFDWDIIQLSSCMFLDKLSIYDLSNEFNADFCCFNDIFIENHIFNSLEFHNCTARVFDFYSDDQDLVMESIDFNYSNFEELNINYHKKYERICRDYDIEVDSIKVLDSNIGKLIISDVQVDRLNIKRSNIYNLVLNEVMSDNDFVFKNLCVDNSEFTNTFVRGKEILGIDKNLKSNVNLIDYDKYIKDLQVLSDLNESPQSRGFAFEKYLKDLFEMNGLQPRGSFKIEGEQIDGSFILHDGIYLLEAKWTNKPIDKGELVIFNEKVSSKSGFTRGLYISYSGYSEGSLKTLSTGRTVNIVLMTVQELEEVLLKKKDFKEFLWAKVRALAEEGNFNKSIVL